MLKLEWLSLWILTVLSVTDWAMTSQESRPRWPNIAGPKGEPGGDGYPAPQTILQKAQPGRDGIPGLDGLNGQKGEPGRDGSNGRPAPYELQQQAQPGRDGRPGLDGLDGQKGIPGIAGPKGQPGRHGRDGRNGLDGLNGQKGERGDIGPPGRPGDGVSIKMSSEPRIITPGDFFLYFQNRKDNTGNVNPFTYPLKTPIVLAPGHRWKVAVIEMMGPWSTDYILCSNIVRECQIGDNEVRIISPLQSYDEDHGDDTMNAMRAFYVSLDDQYVGVPITEIKFELKELKPGSVSNPSLRSGTNISGLLHIKCE